MWCCQSTRGAFLSCLWSGAWWVGHDDRYHCRSWGAWYIERARRTWNLSQYAEHKREYHLPVAHRQFDDYGTVAASTYAQAAVYHPGKCRKGWLWGCL